MTVSENEPPPTSPQSSTLKRTLDTLQPCQETSSNSKESSPTTPRTPKASLFFPARKLVLSKPDYHSPRSPLRIKIPQLFPGTTTIHVRGVPAASIASGSSSSESEPESEGDSEDSSEDSSEEPTTPRASILSPRTSASIVTFSSPVSPNGFDDVSDLELGSLCIAERSYPSPSSNLPFSRRPPLRPACVGPFQFLRTLNKGSYGTAYAARDVSTSQVLCAKVCLKKRVREGKDFIRGMVTELRAYKRIAASEEGLRTWLMELHGVVQDPERVIFMMDLMETDLFAVLANPPQKRLVKRWLAQIALGIDALHSIGIIHRDIKPENILLSAASSDVRIRITDFTNSWIAPGDTADEWQRAYDVAPGSPLEWWRVYSKRYIGTKEYLAPEIRKKQWYGIMVDWWSLGCLAYDLIAGDALFPDDRSVNFYYKWEAEKTTSPYVLYRAGFLEEDEASMMSGLLNLEPHSRFRLQHLKKHPFFVDRRTRHNVFDELRGPPSSPTIPSLGGSDELAVHYTLEEEPMCYAAPEPYREDGMPASKAQVMFDQFGWINPNGMWAHR